MDAITKFRGVHGFLSNFAPCEIRMRGVVYPSAEHAYQAAKTLDMAMRLEIAKASTPVAAKRWGKQVVLRPGWKDMRLEVMTGIVRQKFTKNARLRAKLVATGDAELIEGNAWDDTYWGVCAGKGENHLGKILMAVRAELQEAKP